MSRPVIILVDPDEGFEKRFRKRLEEENIGDRYDLRRVVPDTTLETRYMITACSNEISQLTQLRIDAL